MTIIYSCVPRGFSRKAELNPVYLVIDVGNVARRGSPLLMMSQAHGFVDGTLKDPGWFK